LRVNAVIVWKRMTQSHNSPQYVRMRWQSRTWGLSESKWRYSFHRVFIIFVFEDKPRHWEFWEREECPVERRWMILTAIGNYTFSFQFWIEMNWTRRDRDKGWAENWSLHWLDLMVIWRMNLLVCFSIDYF
jgi:hypothetical protein